MNQKIFLFVSQIFLCACYDRKNLARMSWSRSAICRTNPFLCLLVRGAVMSIITKCSLVSTRFIDVLTSLTEFKSRKDITTKAFRLSEAIHETIHIRWWRMEVEGVGLGIGTRSNTNCIQIGRVLKFCKSYSYTKKKIQIKMKKLFFSNQKLLKQKRSMEQKISNQVKRSTSC